jgi:hypothetical protein
MSALQRRTPLAKLTQGKRDAVAVGDQDIAKVETREGVQLDLATAVSFHSVKLVVGVTPWIMWCPLVREWLRQCSLAGRGHARSEQ